MEKKQFQKKFGKIILTTNLLILLLLFILSIPPVNAFTLTEFKNVLKVLLPINAVYISAIVNQVRKQNKSISTRPDKILSDQYMDVAKTMVFSHIALIVFLIIYTSIGKFTVDTCTDLMSVGEGFFGVYVTTFVSDIFDK